MNELTREQKINFLVDIMNSGDLSGKNQVYVCNRLSDTFKIPAYYSYQAFPELMLFSNRANEICYFENGVKDEIDNQNRAIILSFIYNMLT